jgi:DNA-binding NarL/FixJ family response regulator
MENCVPDIVFLDISMPELDGYQAASQITTRFPVTKIIVLTMHNTEEHILPMIKLGVHGYVLKNGGKSEVLRSIYSVLESGQYFGDEITAKIAASKKAKTDTVKLSERELEVLQLVYEGLSTNRISEKLFISPRTVETHRKNLLNKTDSANTAQLIHFAIGHKLLKTQA